MRLALFAYPGALAMGIEGIRETLELANRYGGAPRFEVRVFRQPLRQRAALTRFLAGGKPSMVVVPPGRLTALDTLMQARLGQELKRLHGRGHTVAAICTGNFALASSGLLTDRTATTHWGLEQELRSRFPTLRLALERILIDHGDVVSVGGLTAFLDFCLWLIAREAGRGLALLVARILQVAPQRQSQLPWMEMAPAVRADDPALRPLVEALERDPRRSWDKRRMAKLAGCAPRTLERRFRAAFGVSPGRFLQEQRLSLARRRLEDGASIDEACAAVGWSDLSSFVRLFKARTGFTPARYRAWTRGESTRPRKVAPR